MTLERSFDYEIFFLSYREPNADENYQDLLKKLSKARFSHVPEVRRVHGVKGIDAAHKRCAELARAPYMLTVDGDCKLDPEFFREVIPHIEPSETSVLIFPAENVVNGLQYGNGSLKIWPVEIILKAGPMGLDYCCTLPRKKGHLINKCYAFTYINSSPEQAWMAGFREGVKLSMLRAGPGPALNDISDDNLRRLRVWCCVGADRPNGLWAILGARQGTLYALADAGAEAARLVNDFDWLRERFSSQEPLREGRLEWLLEQAGEALRKLYDFEVVTFNRNKSRIFKLAYFNPRYIAADDGWVSVGRH
jgi:hypothetical protein